MPKTVAVFSSPDVTLTCEPEQQLISHQILRPVSGLPFRQALEAGVEAMKAHGCTKWLSDDRKNGPLTPEDFEWADRTWAQSAISAGWKTWALILPAEARGKMDLDRHAKLYRQRGVVVLTFIEPNAARTWLLSR